MDTVYLTILPQGSLRESFRRAIFLPEVVDCLSKRVMLAFYDVRNFVIMYV